MDEKQDVSRDTSRATRTDANPVNEVKSPITVASHTAASGVPPNQSPDIQNTSVLLRNIADRTLVFLSNASNEVLGACLVGLGASTYLILGRVGLVLIGAVGGIVLHATWIQTEGSDSDGEAKLKEAGRRREVGLDIVNRVLHWRDKNLPDYDAELSLDEQKTSTSNSSSAEFANFRPETAAALTTLTDAVIRDYVKWWYSPILPADLSFPSTCRRTLTSFLTALSTNMSRKRPADTFVEFATNSSSIILVVFSELSAALTASPNVPTSEAINAYLKLKPLSSLANIVDRKHQHRKLQVVADDILESYLDVNVYRCSPSRVFLREMLANIIIDVTIEKCSQAEWINDWIVYLLEEGEPELMNVIDAGVENSGAQEVLVGSGTGSKRMSKVTDAADTEMAANGPSPIPKGHKKSVSRAEEAMDEAMREAQRLTQMIMEEEERRQKEQQNSTANLSDHSESTTHGIATPTSSQSDMNGDEVHEAVSATHGHPLPDQQESNSTGTTSFTSFDQLAPPNPVTALQEGMISLPSKEPEILTLHKANVSIIEDGNPADKRPIKMKPTVEYLIQIEPASSAFPGWMIARTYADFETLHEVLRRISNITGVDFTKSHANLPLWKGLTKLQLKDELERYLQDALRFDQLAESEGMKRFLDKNQGLARSSVSKTAFWPNPTKVGKGMFDVLTKAPNQVAGGGKAIIGGVTNAFSAVGAVGAGQAPKKASNASVSLPRNTSDTVRESTSLNGSRTSFEQEGPRKSVSPRLNQEGFRPSFEQRNGSNPPEGKDGESTSSRSSLATDRTLPPKIQTSSASASRPSDVRLPPPPEEISDDYSAPRKSPSRPNMPERVSQMSVDGTDFFDVPTPPSSRSPLPKSPQSEKPPAVPSSRQGSENPAKKRISPLSQPLSEPEAQVTIELLFAVINELYTLSSAWNIRRTLLTAAKGFLLRPGNPQLESIRIMIQESMLEANTSDSGIAGHILKLRENSLPTEEEYETWPKPRDEKEKEKLRQKARKLLIERGMPQALTSVMGAAASGEALGKVFDCLQIEDVARGVMFGLMLQAIRAMTQ